MNIVIDTNIWITFLIGHVLDEMEDRFFENDVNIISSDAQLREISEVIRRQKFVQRFSDFERLQLEEYMVKTAYRVDPIEHIEVCRDPKDNFLLEIAASTDVDYIVTGDDDLLILGEFRNTKIIRLSEFREMLSAG